MRKVAYEVFDVCGHEPLIEIALALEKVRLEAWVWMGSRVRGRRLVWAAMCERGSLDVCGKGVPR